MPTIKGSSAPWGFRILDIVGSLQSPVPVIVNPVIIFRLKNSNTQKSNTPLYTGRGFSSELFHLIILLNNLSWVSMHCHFFFTILTIRGDPYLKKSNFFLTPDITNHTPIESPD
jgi:hypothetical protein